MGCFLNLFNYDRLDWLQTIEELRSSYYSSTKLEILLLFLGTNKA
jgi:hypothetical protein